MFKKIIYNKFFIFFLSFFFILGCGDNNSESSKNINSSQNNADVEYSVSFSDQMGDKNFNARPTKVASFSPEVREVSKN